MSFPGRWKPKLLISLPVKRAQDSLQENVTKEEKWVGGRFYFTVNWCFPVFLKARMKCSWGLSIPSRELSLPNVLQRAEPTQRSDFPSLVQRPTAPQNGEFPLPWIRHACAHPWVTVASVGHVGRGGALLGQPAEKPKHGAPAGGPLSSLSSPTCLFPAQHTPANPLTLLLHFLYADVTYKWRQWLLETLSDWIKVTQFASPEKGV